MLNVTIGNRLRELRRIKALSAEKVAAQLGVSPSIIRHYELGYGGKPNKELLDKMAVLYGVDANELYKGYGYTEFKETPDKSPTSILSDVTLALKAYIPVIDSAGNCVDYISCSWQAVPNLKRAYLIDNNDLAPTIIKGDIIVVDSHAKPKEDSIKVKAGIVTYVIRKL
jgi:transcriptional regulator with XRE-family HTH domain